MSLLAAVFVALFGVLVAWAWATAQPMPTCTLCGHELDACTCYGAGKERE